MNRIGHAHHCFLCVCHVVSPVYSLNLSSWVWRAWPAFSASRIGEGLWGSAWHTCAQDTSHMLLFIIFLLLVASYNWTTILTCSCPNLSMWHQMSCDTCHTTFSNVSLMLFGISRFVSVSDLCSRADQRHRFFYVVFTNHLTQPLWHTHAFLFETSNFLWQSKNERNNFGWVEASQTWSIRVCEEAKTWTRL